MPPPVPPMVKDGRMIAGRPTSASAISACAERCSLIALAPLGLAERPALLVGRQGRLARRRISVARLDPGDLGQVGLSRSAFFRRGGVGERAISASRSPILVMASRNSWRSSALSIASAVAPIISTPNLSSVPIFGAATARS